MRSATAGAPGYDTVDFETIHSRTTKTKLGDSYLPALRNFATTNRAQVKSSAV